MFTQALVHTKNIFSYFWDTKIEKDFMRQYVGDLVDKDLAFLFNTSYSSPKSFIFENSCDFTFLQKCVLSTHEYPPINCYLRERISFLKKDYEKKIKRIVLKKWFVYDNEGILKNNILSDSSFTALHLAAAFANVASSTETVKILIEAGVNIMCTTNSLLTPLQLSIMLSCVQVASNKDVVNILIDAGGYINEQEISYDSSFILSICYADLSVTQKLIDYKINTNIINLLGLNCLHLAICYLGINCHLQTIELLTSINDYVDAKEKNGLTPLHMACLCVNLDNKTPLKTIVDYIYQNKLSNKITSYQNTFRYTKINMVEIVKCLLAAKADINALDNNGLTPLHLAILSGNKKVIKLLIKTNKINYSIITNKGENLLEFMANNDQMLIKIVEALLSSDVDIDLNWDSIVIILKKFNIIKVLFTFLGRNKSLDLMVRRNNVLHFLVSTTDDKTIYEQLLNFDIDINLQDYYGYSALHRAIMTNNISIIKLLIDRGINLNLKSSSGTALTILINRDMPENLVNLLIMHGSTVDYNILALALKKYKKCKSSNSLEIFKNILNIINLEVIGDHFEVFYKNLGKYQGLPKIYVHEKIKNQSKDGCGECYICFSDKKLIKCRYNHYICTSCIDNNFYCSVCNTLFFL